MRNMNWIYPWLFESVVWVSSFVQWIKWSLCERCLCCWIVRSDWFDRLRTIQCILNKNVNSLVFFLICISDTCGGREMSCFCHMVIKNSRMFNSSLTSVETRSSIYDIYWNVIIENEFWWAWIIEIETDNSLSRCENRSSCTIRSYCLYLSVNHIRCFVWHLCISSNFIILKRTYWVIENISFLFCKNDVNGIIYSIISRYCEIFECY